MTVVIIMTIMTLGIIMMITTLGITDLPPCAPATHFTAHTPIPRNTHPPRATYSTTFTCHGEILQLKDFIVHPRLGRGQVIAFFKGEGLGFAEIYFEKDGVHKELDLNIADIQREK